MTSYNGTIYLLHFERPLHHARHYIGWTQKDVAERLARHLDGNANRRGSKLVYHARRQGLRMVVARLWLEVDRHYERSLKKRGGASRLCPICKAIEEQEQ